MASTAKYAPGRQRGRRPTSKRPSFRRGGLIGALLLAVLALTGCVTVQLDATVHPDGTLSGSTRFGVAKSAAALAGGIDAVRQQLSSSAPCDFGGHQGSTSDFDDGTYVGITCAFDHVTMAEFNSGEQGPKLSRVGDEFRLTGNLNIAQVVASSGGLLGPLVPSGAVPAPSGLPTDLTSLLPSGIPTDLASLLPSGIPTDLASLLPSGLPTGGLDPSTLLKTAKISFAFTFPGDVRASRGKVHGHKVTFSPDANGNIDFDTTASATASSGTGPMRWLVIAAVILALLAAAGVLIARRRSKLRVPAAVGGYPPGTYPPAYWPNQPHGAQNDLGHGYDPGQSFPGQGYQGQPHPTQPYLPTQPYAGPPSQPPYPGQTHPGQPYSGQPHPGPEYPTQPYSGSARPQADEPSPWARPPADQDRSPEEGNPG